jgi:hypothetical protein
VTGGGVVTSETVRAQGRRLWRGLEVITTLGAIVISVLLASGWRVQKPSEVMVNVEASLDSLERRTATLEANYTTLNAGQLTIMRLQCLATTRRDANYAGACRDLPTRDESPSARR